MVRLVSKVHHGKESVDLWSPRPRKKFGMNFHYFNGRANKAACFKLPSLARRPPGGGGYSHKVRIGVCREGP